MKSILFALSALGLAALPAAAFAVPAGPLDGAAYTGQMGLEGDKDGDADEFIFANGGFDSTGCHQYGYGKGSYEMVGDPSDREFKALTRNKEGSKIEWRGNVDGDTIEGKATQYTKNNEVLRRFWFRGERK